MALGRREAARARDSRSAGPGRDPRDAPVEDVAAALGQRDARGLPVAVGARRGTARRGSRAPRRARSPRPPRPSARRAEPAFRGARARRLDPPRRFARHGREARVPSSSRDPPTRRRARGRRRRTACRRPRLRISVDGALDRGDQRLGRERLEEDAGARRPRSCRRSPPVRCAIGQRAVALREQLHEPARLEARRHEHAVGCPRRCAATSASSQPIATNTRRGQRAAASRRRATSAASPSPTQHQRRAVSRSARAARRSSTSQPFWAARRPIAASRRPGSGASSASRFEQRVATGCRAASGTRR